MRWWPISRAVLITLAIAIGLVEGCPLPEREQEAQMPSAVVDALHAVARVRSVVMWPFAPIGEYTYVRQRWKLFAGANKLRYRMSVDARTGPGADWQVLYRPLDDDHTFDADQLAYRRMRGSWAPRGLQGPRGAYQHFATWIAREVFESDPRWTDVRVQMEEVQIGDSGGDTFTGHFVFPILRTRAEVMP